MEIRSKESCETYEWGKKSRGWHFLKRDDLSVIYEEIAAGEEEVEHYHSKSRQFFYIISGRLKFLIGDEEHPLRENEGIEIEPGIPHKVINDREEATRFLAISMPPSHGDRIPVERDTPSVG